MLFFYLLVYWVIEDPGRMSDVARYLRSAFDGVNVFYFDRDFLDAVATTPEALHRARQLFKGRANNPITELYARARAVAGLA